MAESLEVLKAFLDPLSPSDREELAERCETTAGHLRNVAYGFRPCSERLAINLERETNGELRCERLCPGVDWAFIRSSSLSTTKRKTG
jgi:DNA-binding transcriptional regulator YdaS (Cro superfamily)